LQDDKNNSGGLQDFNISISWIPLPDKANNSKPDVVENGSAPADSGVNVTSGSSQNETGSDDLLPANTSSSIEWDILEQKIKDSYANIFY